MKKEILLMTTGIFVGTLLCHGGGAAAAGTVAEPSWQPIFVNGEQVQMEAYNIHGNNFVKLRDIGQAVLRTLPPGPGHRPAPGRAHGAPVGRPGLRNGRTECE